MCYLNRLWLNQSVLSTSVKYDPRLLLATVVHNTTVAAVDVILGEEEERVLLSVAITKVAARMKDSLS